MLTKFSSLEGDLAIILAFKAVYHAGDCVQAGAFKSEEADNLAFSSSKSTGSRAFFLASPLTWKSTGLVLASENSFLEYRLLQQLTADHGVDQVIFGEIIVVDKGPDIRGHLAG